VAQKTIEVSHAEYMNNPATTIIVAVWKSIGACLRHIIISLLFALDDSGTPRHQVHRGPLGNRNKRMCQVSAQPRFDRRFEG
jgi:hypothetical protein